MKMEELREQIKTCLASDLVEEAKLAWVLLAVTNGIGKSSAAKQLGITEERVEEVWEALSELNLIEKPNCKDRWVAVKFIAAPKARTIRTRNGEVIHVNAETEVVREALITAYDKWKQRRGTPRLYVDDKIIDHFNVMAARFVKADVSVSQATLYFEYAVEKTQFIREKERHRKGTPWVPAIGLLAGAWLFGEWMNDEGPKGAAKNSTEIARGRLREPEAHAGHSYRDATSLRTQLQGAGFESAAKFTKAQLRFIEEAAFNLLEMPKSHIPHDRWEAEIQWLAKEIGRDQDSKR